MEQRPDFAGGSQQYLRTTQYATGAKLDARSHLLPNGAMARLDLHVDDETMALLRLRAAALGVSLEDEAAHIVRAAVVDAAQLGDLAGSLFGDAGVDLELPARAVHEPVAVAE
jgi:plasmid stability protein